MKPNCKYKLPNYNKSHYYEERQGTVCGTNGFSMGPLPKFRVATSKQWEAKILSIIWDNFSLFLVLHKKTYVTLINEINPLPDHSSVMQCKMDAYSEGANGKRVKRGPLNFSFSALPQVGSDYCSWPHRHKKQTNITALTLSQKWRQRLGHPLDVDTAHGGRGWCWTAEVDSATPTSLKP